MVSLQYKRTLIFSVCSRERISTLAHASVNSPERTLGQVGCCSPLCLADWNFSSTLSREHGSKKWNKEETFVTIQHYERFPELWHITLPEYRNTAHKMCKIKKKYQRAWEFQIKKLLENGILFEAKCVQNRGNWKRKIFLRRENNLQEVREVCPWSSAVNYVVYCTHFELSSEGAKCSKLCTFETHYLITR